MTQPTIIRTADNAFDIYSPCGLFVDDLTNQSSFTQTIFNRPMARNGAGASGVTVQFNNDDDLALFILSNASKIIDRRN